MNDWYMFWTIPPPHSNPTSILPLENRKWTKMTKKKEVEMYHCKKKWRTSKVWKNLKTFHPFFDFHSLDCASPKFSRGLLDMIGNIVDELSECWEYIPWRQRRRRSISRSKWKMDSTNLRSKNWMDPKRVQKREVQENDSIQELSFSLPWLGLWINLVHLRYYFWSFDRAKSSG